MGKTKLERMVRNMVISAVRSAAPLVNAIPEQCKACGSKRIVRYGYYQDVQRWKCKDCQRTFIHNEAPLGMKTSVVQIASALSMYYEGMSLNAIRRHLEQTYRNYPSDSTVYEWIVRYTKIAIEAAKDYKPDVGSVWLADETVLKIGGEKIWFWDLIDHRTRFLLASHMSITRTTRDAHTLMERASKRANKVPRVVITDKLQAYLDGIEIAFGAETKHIAAKGLTAKTSTNLIERMQGTIKARTKVMRGLKQRKTAKLIMDGFLVHYNFFRPHEGIGNLTPASKAGIKFPFKNWLDVVRKAS